jgi:stage IV sporulation protein FB
MGHAISAQKVGYRLVNVNLLPFGAVINGDVSGMGYVDEIKVALAGPFINFCIGVGIVALWWVFPQAYPYTELAASASFALCVINLVPAFPLDGGRVLLCTLTLLMQRQKAVAVCKSVGIGFSSLFLGLFIYSCFKEVNFSLLLFSAFMFAGVFSKNSDDRYVRIYHSLSYDDLKAGKPIKSFAISEDFTVKRLYRKIDSGYLYRIYVFSNSGKVKKILEPNEVVNLLQEKLPNEKIL